ncbi:MAG: lysylphosphatidylglycerol synthase domain-containing protein [Bacteroidia bacterium]
MVVNWSFEAIKWKILIEKIQKINFYTSLKAVMAGITVSAFTPNRVGEFGGRIFFLEPENRSKGIVLTFLGNTAQLLVTIVIGAFVFMFYLAFFTPLKNYFLILIDLLMVLIIIFFPLIYFKNERFKKYFFKLKFLRKHEEKINLFFTFSSSELLNLLFFSFCRYIIFTMQFYFLLCVFGVEIPFLSACILIVMIFSTTTFIPTFALTELGVRSSAAILFLGIFSPNVIGIALASIALWIVNIALPALIGSFTIFKIPFFKQK